MEERIDNKDSYDPNAAFQYAWSGEENSNQDWVEKFGGVGGKLMYCEIKIKVY